MTEQEFSNILARALRKALRGYSVSVSDALIYKVIVNQDGKFHPKNPAQPKRGQLSFQTDILIKKKDIPLVVIETKIDDFSTHDVLTYSTKAVKHKEIYPYLRYGFVVGKSKVIGNKFFTHNQGFDFALAIPSIRKLDNFIKVVKDQIKGARLLLNILKDKHKTAIYSSIIKIENV